MAASGSLISATAAHLARFPWRDCHILTYIRQHSSGQGPIYLPVVIQGPSEDHSTVLSRDAVAKACPSGDHAQSQIIRECDLSMVMGTYPSGGYAKLVRNYFPRHRLKKRKKKKKNKLREMSHLIHLFFGTGAKSYRGRRSRRADHPG